MSSDEEDQDYRPSKKRKVSKTSSLSGKDFLDLEAVHSDDDGEEELSQEDKDFIADDTTEEIEATRLARKLVSRPFESRPSRLQQSEKFLKTLEEKYKDGEELHVQEYEEYPEEVVSGKRGIRQQKQYPTVKDPKLFMVHCKFGKEREAVLILLQKVYNMEKMGKPLQIKSALCLDSLKRYIYVEAHKESHVKQAIKNIRLLSERGMKIVPIDEMTDVLTIGRKTVELKKDQWVRVKRGTYKGDLAQVWDVDEARSVAIIKIVPRLDPVGSEGTKSEGRGKIQRKKRLFNEEEVRQAGGQIQHRRDTRTKELFTLYQGKRFKDGYLFKVVDFRSLETKNIQPTPDELQQFQYNPNELDNTITTIGYTRKVKFNKGDIVKVVDGDLKHLMGTVYDVDTETDTVTIMPKHEKLKDPLQFPANQLQKHFDVGTFVKVIAGQYEGSTGHIVRVDKDTVTLYSDTLVQEMKVFIHDICKASETTSNETSVGNYTLHDLVRIDSQTAGVITKIEKETFQLLDNNGNLLTLKLQELGRKMSSRPSAYKTQDRNNTMIGVEDTVKVIEGPFKGREGIVKHIFRVFVWVHSRDMLENSGIFVVRGKFCELSGGRSQLFKSQNFTSRQPIRSIVGNRRRRNHPLVNKTVTICKGPYKGYIGVVVDVTNHAIRVELHSHFKTITLKTGGDNIYECVKQIEEERRTTVQRPYSQPYDRYSSRTPLRGEGSETPMPDGSRTPMPYDDGSRTPGTPRTPGPSDVWNPKTPNTPRHGYDDYPTTPSNVKTPYSPYSPSVQTSSYTPTVQTPGVFSSTVQTPGVNYTTPLSGMQTPGGSSYGTPLNTPGGSLQTPTMIQSPVIQTPGGIQTPITPGINSDDIKDEEEEEEENWCEPNIEVEITEGQYANMVGVVRGVNKNMCTVILQQNDEERAVEIEASKMKPTVPKNKDIVKVIKGDHKGKIGHFAGMDDESKEAIIRFPEHSEQLGLVPLSYVVKIVSQY